jgi:ribosomal protein S18 acetylase RimI-like enzyme
LSVSEFRALYGAIGAAHLWHTRLQLSDEALTAWLTATDVAVDILMLGRRPVGLVELDFRQEGLCQLAHLGVLPGFRGRGLGQSLLAHALAKASRPGVHTLWLSTSSFDAPSALPFYLKAGFRFDRYAVEIFEDPRLNKLLPADSCARWPLAPLATP